MDVPVLSYEYSQAEIDEIRAAIREEPLEIEIVSGSMHPVLQVGSIYKAIWVEPKELKRFDIIVFTIGQEFICHYVWHLNREIDAGTLITRALNGGAEDLPIPVGKLLGKIIDAKIPRLTRLKLLAATTWGA